LYVLIYVCINFKFRHRQQQFGHVLNASNFNALGLDNSPNKRTSSFFLPDEVS